MKLILRSEYKDELIERITNKLEKVLPDYCNDTYVIIEVVDTAKD